MILIVFCFFVVLMMYVRIIFCVSYLLFLNI